MNERTFTNNEEIDENKRHQILPIRSTIAKEIFEAEARFNVKVVAIAFRQKDSGKPDYNVELIIDDGGDYEYCDDPGCICSGRDKIIIEHNMLDGWSREESEALLGEHKYGGM